MTNIELETLGAVKRAALKYAQEKKEIDWEQRRYEIAKECLPKFATTQWNEGYYNSPDVVAIDAVKYADSLIKVLKNKTL